MSSVSYTHLYDIDWEQTTAVANRGIHIYLNLKGRNPNGIVDPADQYELEEKIMTDLYSYRHPQSGHRLVALAPVSYTHLYCHHFPRLILAPHPPPGSERIRSRGPPWRPLPSKLGSVRCLF